LGRERRTVGMGRDGQLPHRPRLLVSMAWPTGPAWGRWWSDIIEAGRVGRRADVSGEPTARSIRRGWSRS